MFYLLVKSGKLQKASPLAHKIAKTNSKSAPLAKLLISLLYINDGKYQKAIDKYESDMNNYKAMNDVYTKYFNNAPPARAAVETVLYPGALIEIMMTAQKP